MFYIPLAGLGIFFVLATRDAARIKNGAEATVRDRPAQALTAD
jgi:hypothetical protein